ncbi:MAG: hypothetical protein HON04_16605 [Planctomicrobium sp.]|nr:hypothetical protein [Planctomicrobium sp.]
MCCSECNDQTARSVSVRVCGTVVPILDSMDDIDLHHLLEEPVLQQVLEIYSELITLAGEDRAEDEQGTRWANRILELTDTDPAALSSIHGRLIAFGWLTFQIEDRNSGLMYRITSDGKKACDWAKKNSKTETVSDAA